MIIDVEAVYEEGVLKPKQPLAFSEGSHVRLTVQNTETEDIPDPFEGVIGIGDGPVAGDGAANHDKYIYGKLEP